MEIKIRKKNTRKKKAVFLTIALVLFALILFSLSLVFVRQKQSENFFVQGNIDRLTNLDWSVQKGLTDLVKQHAGITVSRDDDKIVITESMPLSFSTLSAKVAGFESFVEGEISAVTITADIQEMPFNLTPKGIFYTHVSGENKILIQRAEFGDTFEFNFEFPENGLGGSCTIQWNSVAAGGVTVKVAAKDTQSGVSCTDQKDLNTAGTSEAQITHALGTVKVKINNNEIEISRTGSNPYTVKTIIELPADEHIVSIKMPEIETNISTPDFGIIGQARFLI